MLRLLNVQRRVPDPTPDLHPQTAAVDLTFRQRGRPYALADATIGPGGCCEPAVRNTFVIVSMLPACRRASGPGYGGQRLWLRSQLRRAAASAAATAAAGPVRYAFVPTCSNVRQWPWCCVFSCRRVGAGPHHRRVTLCCQHAPVAQEGTDIGCCQARMPRLSAVCTA